MSENDFTPEEWQHAERIRAKLPLLTTSGNEWTTELVAAVIRADRERAR